jgi:glycosyltransferase involved in cell wall biosynthesis
MKLAVITTHPVQYYAPWFRCLAAETDIQLRVFYLWNPEVTRHRDRTFQRQVEWDIPLLDGYPWEWVPNRSKDPGSHHFMGLYNPAIVRRVIAFQPDAALLFGYAYLTHMLMIGSPYLKAIPFLFRGDSHLFGRPIPYPYSLKKIFRKLVFKRFARFLAVGKANHDYFLEHGVRNNQIDHCPHCVDNDRFSLTEQQRIRSRNQWRQAWNIPDHHDVILFVGKFETKKQPVELLRAFLEADLDRTSLVFVGSGELERELRTLAGEAGAQQVVFSGFANQSVMPEVYAAADLLILPSRGHAETWGLCVNEAMASGLPVIVSSHVGCGPDLVEPGKTGWVFDALSYHEMVRVLKEAVAVREDWKKMGRLSRKTILNYSFSEAGRSLERSLKKLPSVH